MSKITLEKSYGTTIYYKKRCGLVSSTKHSYKKLADLKDEITI